MRQRNAPVPYSTKDTGETPIDGCELASEPHFDRIDGTEAVDVGLDELLDGARVSFIKLNIEGSELEALRGARRSIRSWKPKLATSVYHRPSDLWEVPELVRSLNQDYRLYVRQHDGGVVETVLYACL